MLESYRKLLEMLLPSERRRFWQLVAITFVLAGFEVASVVAILPFLRLLADPGLIQTTPLLATLYETFDFGSTQAFLAVAGGLVFVITVLGFVVKMVGIWMVSRFSLMRGYTFSARLLAGYLRQPYAWFLSRHTSDLGNKVLSEVDQVVVSSLLPAMRIIPEIFIALLLVVGLLILEPYIALGGALILTVAYLIVFQLVRRELSRLGEERLEANRRRFHTMQEATGGLKDMKVLGREALYLQRFRAAALQMAQKRTRIEVLLQVPRYLIEALAFGSMILLILVLLYREAGSVAALVPTLGLIAATGLKLIPAIQQIYFRVSSMRQSKPSLDEIHSDLTSLGSAGENWAIAKETVAPRPLERALELRGIRYRYPSADKNSLDDLNLTIRANTSVGIVGSTGAGKTTLVDVMLALLEPDAGEMLVDGVPIDATTRRGWQRALGYVPQTIFLTDGTLAENIAFGLPAEEIDLEKVERAARVAALHDYVMTSSPDGYQTPVGERGVRLSGGQRQRVGIARALYNDPSMLIFDEATSALDTLTERAVMEAVENIAGRKTIVMIAHRLSTIRNCDQILLLREGRLASAGSYDELIETDAQFRSMAAS